MWLINLVTKINTLLENIGIANENIDYLGEDVGDIGELVANMYDNLGEHIFDYVPVPFVPANGATALGFLLTGYYHVHGASFIRPDKADPVTLTSSATAWSETGTIVEVIPAGNIGFDFDIHWASVSDISANFYGVVDLFAGASGSEVKIGSVDVTRTSNFSQEGNKPVQIPQQPAMTRISARFSDSTSSAQTCKIKLYGHTYATAVEPA